MTTTSEGARGPRLAGKLRMILELLAGEELIDALGMLDVAHHKLLTGTIPTKGPDEDEKKAIKA